VAKQSLTPICSFSAPVPSTVFDTYWKFATERQEIYFKRLGGKPGPWSTDHVLTDFRFTNVYRASDRTSQFLIREILYSSRLDADDIVFRTLLFKIFNKSETWLAL